MFRELRRKRQALPAEACERILRERGTGVLAVSGDEGWPYAVPLNYVWLDGKLYFHGARAGHKLDAIRRESRASFCVIDRDENVPERFTTYFSSVIVFGHVAPIDGDAEKRRAVRALADKFSPDEPEEAREREIDREWNALCVLCLTPDHISGKQAIELVAQSRD